MPIRRVDVVSVVVLKVAPANYRFVIVPKRCVYAHKFDHRMSHFPVKELIGH